MDISPLSISVIDVSQGYYGFSAYPRWPILEAPWIHKMGPYGSKCALHVDLFIFTTKTVMAVQRKSDGGPNHKFFESQETIAQFDSVKSWLQRNCKKVCSALLGTSSPHVFTTRKPVSASDDLVEKQNNRFDRFSLFKLLFI